MSISRVDVGTPPDNFEGWTTANICFHGFAKLTTTRGECVRSTKFSCLGHQWRLWIYPGGDDDSTEGYAAVELVNMTNKSIKISYGFSVRDVDGEEVVRYKPQTKEFDASGGNNAGTRITFPRDQNLWNYWYKAR